MSKTKKITLILIIIPLCLIFSLSVTSNSEAFSSANITLSESIEINDSQDIHKNDSNSFLYVYVVITIIGAIVANILLFIAGRQKDSKLQQILKKYYTRPICALIIYPLILFITFTFADVFSSGMNFFIGDYKVAKMIIGIIPVALAVPLITPYVTKSLGEPTKDYFEKDGYENSTKEYGLIKKITVISAFFAIVGISVSAFLDLKIENLSSDQNIPLALGFAGGNSFYLSLSRMGFLSTKSDLKLYLAKGYFRLAENEENILKKLHFVMLGINNYDKFLARNIKLRFGSLSFLYVKLIDNLENHDNTTFKTLADSFSSENELAPVNTISNIIGLSKENLLIKDSLYEKSKEWIPAIIGITASTIAIVNFLVDFF